MLITDMCKNILHLHVKMVKKENKIKSTFIIRKPVALFSSSPIYKQYFHTFIFGK